ncbi:glycine-rich domain-containing protein [Aliiroseovarius marinus]|uniref:glycine-rich domain-containing protein n=1 Tax=Aliiroseovarius marinus TaxID=2500159 RepID=UPI003D7DBDFD
MQSENLWKAIQAHQFDAPGADLPFSRKLAKIEGWSDAFTQGAIEEYRRFLFLSQLSDKPVTPSHIVDKVWHMHMTYTRDYWDVLCKTVLGKPLHHEPGMHFDDSARFEEQFDHTKALYHAVFESPAPDSYWGPPPKPRASRFRIAVATLVAAALVAAGLVTADSSYVIMSLVLAFCAWFYISGVLIAGKPISAHIKTGDHAGCATGCGGD